MLQRKKAHQYVIFKIDEKKNEVVEKTGNPTESYDDFTSALPENDCRYAVFDFDFVTSKNCQKSKTFFIAWFIDMANSMTAALRGRRCSVCLQMTTHLRDHPNTPIRAEAMAVVVEGGGAQSGGQIGWVLVVGEIGGRRFGWIGKEVEKKIWVTLFCVV
ncbi:hypothetical protein M8C21_006648 [Ambrosia artemisiifolia]|uniref:ADF-H domain-containing protein n=1 Tax=Ambrosia artemisiifolia TaxID=4212 RepID=A0AAD5D6I8_AMBAR|nr:hypothetical protein M8C21_006648 [Ambrosia artemisiifolia]